MKVGVMTLFFEYNWDNYGGALQNYALMNYLKKLGHQVYTIAPLHRITKYPLYDKFNRFVYMKWGISLVRRGKILVPRYIGVQKKRNDAFNNFAKKYIPRMHYRISGENPYKKMERDFDIFVAGSDQVWNSYFALTPATYKDYLLAFAPNNKRISYAASFGTSVINPEWEDTLRTELRKFKAISVRETSGKKIVKDLIGVEAEELVDPTLLLSVDEWREIEKKPTFLKKNESYLLTYFLGEKTEDAKKEIQVIAKENNLKIYNLYDKSQEEVYALGPREFVYMIEHAKIVMTDSFHACVFSFLFDRPFFVFQRKDKTKSMQSRIENFLEKFDLQRKSADAIDKRKLFENDYKKGKQILENEKILSREFLLRNINE